MKTSTLICAYGLALASAKPVPESGRFIMTVAEAQQLTSPTESTLEARQNFSNGGFSSGFGGGFDATSLFASSDLSGFFGQNQDFSQLFGANLQFAQLLGGNAQLSGLFGANIQLNSFFASNPQLIQLWSANIQLSQLLAGNAQLAQLWSQNLQLAQILGVNSGFNSLFGLNQQFAQVLAVQPQFIPIIQNSAFFGQVNQFIPGFNFLWDANLQLAQFLGGVGVDPLLQLGLAGNNFAFPPTVPGNGQFVDPFQGLNLNGIQQDPNVQFDPNLIQQQIDDAEDVNNNVQESASATLNVASATASVDLGVATGG